MLLRLFLLALSAGLITGASSAQVQATFPKGFTNKPGNAAFPLGQIDIFGLPITEGWTVVDATRLGAPQLIKALHLRQSQAVPVDPASTLTRMQLHMRLGHADMTKVPVAGPVQMSNVVTSWTTMHSGTKIDFPDMTQLPSTLPSPWALRIPMPRPFAYDGKQGFVLQCYAEPVSGIAPTFAFDGVDESRAHSFGKGQVTGSGCRSQGTEIHVRGVWTTHADVRRDVKLDVVSYPMTSEYPNETILLIGATNPALAIAFCTQLYSSADLILPMNGSALVDSNKSLGRSLTLHLPYKKHMIGLQLHLQSWSIDRFATPLQLVGSDGFLTGGLPARPQPSLALHVSTAGPGPGGFPDLVVLRGHAGPILGVE